MSTTRGVSRAPDAPGSPDEEFMQNLQRGGELLASGKVNEAKEHLEKAYHLQPKSEKGRNLLGLTYFKLGLFDRATEIYEKLVDENPTDPTLRVNLGLVFLKAKSLDRAVHEFEVAADLAPDHKKAHNYLGLALAQAGRFAQAKDHFIKAGSDQMAEKMGAAMKPVNAVPSAPVVTADPTHIIGLQAVPFERAEDEPDDGEDVAIEEDPPFDVDGDGQVVNATAEYGTGLPVGSPASDAGLDAFMSQSPQVQQHPPPSSSSASWSTANEGIAAAAYERAEQSEEVELVTPGPLPSVMVDESQLGEQMQDQGVRHIEAFAGEDEVEESGITLLNAMDPSHVAAQPEVEVHVEGVDPVDASMSSGLYGSAAGLGARAVHLPEHMTAVSGAAGVSLKELAASSRIAPPSSSGAFQVTPDLVTIMVRGEMLTRVFGLIATSGALKLQPEVKRYRGRPTEQPFGDGDDQLVRATGKGVLLIDPRTCTFLVVELSDDSAYFREEVVFAFEEQVSFDNGRVPSDGGMDLDLVHLRGEGKALLRLPGPLRSMPVVSDFPVTVPVENLAGWQGNLNPRLVSLVTGEGGKALRAGIELSGEGFALFSAPLG